MISSAQANGLLKRVLAPAMLLLTAMAMGANRDALQAMRLAGDVAAQRAHGWALFASLNAGPGAVAAPAWAAWPGEDETFNADPGAMPSATVPLFQRARPSPASAAGLTDDAVQSAGAPLLVYTQYNPATYQHIRRHQLYNKLALQRMRLSADADAVVSQNPSIPEFPATAVIIKTVWWAVANEAVTPLPVWDPELNPERRGGNDYTSWKRVVAVDTHAAPARSVSVVFAGRQFHGIAPVALSQFHHLRLSAATARTLMADVSANKAAQLMLGRPLAAGDYLILVAMHVATKEQRDWVWATYWWHDRPTHGAFASDRPANLPGPWRHFLMDVAFDGVLPRASDGGPKVCFNPWLEGRFPRGPQGGGRASNCMSCHRRASYPSPAFLPVTRGDAHLARDPAFAPGQLRTNFLWSIAMRSNR